MMLVVAQCVDLGAQGIEPAQRLDWREVDVVRRDGGDPTCRVSDLALELAIAAVRDRERRAQQKRQRGTARERRTPQKSDAFPALGESNRCLVGEDDLVK